MRSLVLPSLLVLLLTGCESRPRSLPDAAPQEAGGAEAAAPLAPEATTELEPPSSLAQSVAKGDWTAAASAFDALPESERKRPIQRFLRARIALELGDAARSLTELEHAETELPLLIDRVTALRAEAFWRAGRADEAAALFERLPGSDHLERAAVAYARAGLGDAVRRVTGRGLAVGKPNVAQQAALRELRLRFEEGKAAEADARWLATEGAANDPNDEGMRWLRGHKLELEVGELMSRGKVLASAGMLAEARQVAGQLERSKVSDAPLESCMLKATAAFNSRGSYKEAHHGYASCEKMAKNPVLKAEASFLAARSLLRADADDDAIVGFERFLERYPKSERVFEAQALIARTHLLQGRYARSKEAYDALARRKPGSGTLADEASRYRAFAALLSGAHAEAKQLFEERSGGRNHTDAQLSTLFSAVAAQRMGDVTTAKARLANLTAKYPWSAAGIYARARLEALGEKPALELERELPAQSPVVVQWPEGAAMLYEIGLDDDAEGYLEPRESVVTAAARGRETEALCSAYQKLDRARRVAKLSSRLPSHLLDHPPSGGARWVWECMYPTPFSATVQAVSKSTQVPASLIYAIMRTESVYNPWARSPVGARGLMQLMPATQARLEAKQPLVLGKEDTLVKRAPPLTAPSPQQNIELGARHLRELFDVTGSWPLAIMAYNGSPEAVVRWRKRLPDLPLDLFATTIPFLETRNYVSKVLEVWARYRAVFGETDLPLAVQLEMPPP